MRTLLAGEFTTATNTDVRADVDVKVEVENGSGTFKDLTALLGRRWVVKVVYGETIENKVMQATITLVQQVGDDTLAPLMEASALNVLDDGVTYSPLLDVGRLVRFSTATTDHGVAPVSGDYRAGLSGRIDRVTLNDKGGVWAGPIELQCSDLGAWLVDTQIETSGIEYGSEAGVALETVIQNVLDANIPTGDPSVTLYKQSSSSFNVTTFKTGETKLMEALQALVLDSTGEDLRYRFDSAHASRLTWFDPDRGRTSVDATFGPRTYILSKLDTAIDDIRNAGEMPFTDIDAGVADVATQESLASVDKYRRRFFRLPPSDLITTEAEAQTVVDAVVNDLQAPPAEAQALLPFCWFVQLYDRYTFQANDRQYSDDQTFCVVGYQHTIENGRASTVLTLTGRVVGAYQEWLKRIRKGGSVFQTASIQRVTDTESSDGTERDFAVVIGSRVDTVHVHYRTVPLDVSGDPLDFSGNETVTEAVTTLIERRVAGSEVITFSIPHPPRGYKVAGRMIPYTRPNPDPIEGASWPFFVDPAPLPFTYTSAATEDTSAGQGTLTVVIADPLASIHTVDRLKFYKTVNGTRTLVSPTTSPAASVTSGTYTLTFDLEAKHNVKVEPMVTYTDTETEVLGAWTFDSDKRANVLNLQAAQADGTATLVAVFDTDTVVSATGARYRVDGGAWTDLSVGSDYVVVWTVALSQSATQLVQVQAKDSDGNYGPTYTIRLGTYVASVAQGTISIESNGSWNATADGPANALSFRWSYSTSAFPADATVTSSGTVVTGTGRLLAMTGTALTFGQTLYITIIPFDAVSAGGNALPAIHLRGAYQTYTKSKTTLYGPTSWVVDPASTQQAYTLGANGWFNNAASGIGGGNTQIYQQVTLPSGATITQVQWDVVDNAGFVANPTLTVIAYRLDGATRTSLGSDASLGGGTQTLSVSVSESTTSRSYMMFAHLMTDSANIAHAAGDQKIGNLYVTYSSPDPSINV